MSEDHIPYALADDGERDPRLSMDLLIVEKAEANPHGRWYLAAALVRSATGTAWIGEPPTQQIEVGPELSWEYWSEKDGNGYNNAVFHYWVESFDVAEELVERRRSELEEGANPYFGQAQQDEVPPVESPPVPPVAATAVPAKDDVEEDDVHVWCRELERTHAMSQALVWRLASELVRRHPKRLWVDAEGGGMYDRISVLDISGASPLFVAVFNAAGTNTSTPAGTGFLWTRAFRGDIDPADWVREFERRCGLEPTIGRLPPSTPSSLAVRWISTFLTSQIGSRRPWFTRPVDHFDPQQVAEVFPDAVAWQRAQRSLEGTLVPLGHLNDAAPRLIVSRAGDVWRDNGERHHLPNLHRSDSPAMALLLGTVPDLLP